MSAQGAPRWEACRKLFAVRAVLVVLCKCGKRTVHGLGQCHVTVARQRAICREFSGAFLAGKLAEEL